MKLKLFIIGLLSATLAVADSDVSGTIVNIDNSTKSITIDTYHSGNTTFKVIPTTKIELSDCGWLGLADSWGISDRGQFTDLKLGQYVEIEAQYIYNSIPVASEIDIKCDKKRAY